MRIIDMDTHFAPTDEFAFVSEEFKEYVPRWVRDDAGRVGVVHPGRPQPTPTSGVFNPRVRHPGNFDYEARLGAMDAMGVEKQMLCQEFSQYCWEIEPRLAAEMARSSNIAVGKALKAHPDRFLGSAVIPIQDMSASLEEAERCLDAGFHAFFMKAEQGGKNFDDPHFWPFYEFANKHDVSIVVHATNQDAGTAITPGRLGSHWGVWVGMLTDFLVQTNALIYGGVFDEFPNLRICFMESGATWLPWMWNRLKVTYDHDPASRGKLRKHPTEYLLSNIYVTVDATEEALGYLCREISWKNLLLGTDYPHGDITGRNGDIDAVGRTHITLLENREDLSQEMKEDIVYNNAVTFLGSRAPSE